MPAHLRRFNEPGHVHFWTISCHRRPGFFHHDGMKQIVVDALKLLQEKFGICLVGYVIMPDHLRVLLYPHARGCDESTDVSRLPNAFKQMGMACFARRISTASKARRARLARFR